MPGIFVVTILWVAIDYFGYKQGSLRTHLIIRMVIRSLFLEVFVRNCSFSNSYNLFEPVTVSSFMPIAM